MNPISKIRFAALGLAAAGLIATTFTTVNAADKKLSGPVRIDGSSTVYPITEAVAEEFSGEAPRVKVTVGVSGTGGGFKRFVIGDTDISDASRPIKGKELKAAKENGINFIEIPVAYDGLTIVVNKKNSWAKNLTVDELKAIFLDSSAVSNWKDVRAGFPDLPIKIYAPGTDSGTFDYFKEVVAGKKGSIRSDMSVSEDDNILVRGVAGNKGAIGFFGCAYYFENTDQLKAVAIDGGKGAVLPSSKTIESGEYAPFSRPLFIYVNAKSVNKPQVDAFVKFYFEQGPALAEEVGYVRLPSAVYAIAKKKYLTVHTGTHFLDADGEKIKGALPDIYK
ncbi:Phosphate-binding protein PstS precursor [Poriferisphaera corsica]|uniref:Phosphate-binding protein n=1 Tax=Poriferisphaera corsica TaxID=2528020 RepID=A0A517YRF6_9BACT|nr:PstS family phosphate ABC transporter substrate-binding protein [Poriferisphaera corsica]QDU32803.1 Phosphate-binding protein PstS precursor [Poriferisphaera corsica]